MIHSNLNCAKTSLEKFMFDQRKTEIKPNAYPVLDTLGFLLQSIPNRIHVEGHPDDTPIHSLQFSSNWHLSVTRSLGPNFIQSGPKKGRS
jgi:flagellar motor protein MotB